MQPAGEVPDLGFASPKTPTQKGQQKDGGIIDKVMGAL